MSQIDIPKNYADGEVLLESDLDAAFEEVETFLNTTKINDDNIQDGGITGSTKLLTGSVTEAKIAAGAITSSKLADSAVTTAKIIDAAVTEAKLATEVVNQLIPVGMVVPFAGSSAPTGWLFCYGQAISRATYADLFAVIGTNYGIGDGSSTFNLPDLRGRVAAGKDDMGGSAASRLTGTTISGGGATLGNSGGAQTHTLITAEMPAHTHDVSIPGYNATSNDNIAAGATAQQNTKTFTSSSTGGGGAHNNVQPTLILNQIIKH